VCGGPGPRRTGEPPGAYPHHLLRQCGTNSPCFTGNSEFRNPHKADHYEKWPTGDRGELLSPAERGRLVRELARHLHEHPDGSQREYSRGTLDRWVRAYREQGLDGLKPEPRSDLGEVRRHPELLNEACALRAELPTRSSAQIAAMLFARHRLRVAERTISQHLRQRGLHRAALAGQPRAFGRFEASRPNELWIGDVLVGPFVPHPRVSGSRRAYLFVLVDDYSRLLVHGRWVADQNTRAGQHVLRAAIQCRGPPERLYVDYADLRIMPISAGVADQPGLRLSA
jgi:putative transposase